MVTRSGVAGGQEGVAGGRESERTDERHARREEARRGCFEALEIFRGGSRELGARGETTWVDDGSDVY